MKYLYAAFSLNLVFTTACGVIAIVNSTFLSNDILHIHPTIIQALGFGLLGFAGLIAYYLIKKPTILLGNFIVLQDLLWIITTCVIAFFIRDTLQSEGIELVILINVCVLIIMILQYASLFQLTKHPVSSEFETYLTIEDEIDSSTEKYWALLSNLKEIHRFSTGVASSTVSGDYGVGAIRTCSDGKKAQWSEEIVEWKKNKSMTMRFDPSIEGFPFPANKMNGGWKIITEGKNTKVMIWFEFNSSGTLARLAVPVFCSLWILGLKPVIKRIDNNAQMIK